MAVSVRVEEEKYERLNPVIVPITVDELIHTPD